MLRTTGCITLMLAMTMTGFGASGCARACGSQTTTEDSGPSPATTSASRVGSCDRVASTGTCSEYSGTYFAQNEILLTSSCGKLGGTFVYAPCPNTSVVGACTLSTTEIRRFYGTGSAAYSPDRAQTECEGSFRGKWEAHR